MKNTKENTIGSRIKEARKSRGYTQLEAGGAFNMDNSAWSKIETGTNKADLDLIVNISKEWGVTTDYLLIGETNNSAVIDISGLSFYRQKLVRDLVDALRCGKNG